MNFLRKKFEKLKPKNKMKHKHFGLSQIILFFSIGISIVSMVLGFGLYLFTSNNIGEVINYSQRNSDSQMLLLKSIKDLALVQSNTLATLGSKSTDDMDIRLEIITGYIQESEKDLKTCGDVCAKIQDDFVKYTAGWKVLSDKLIKDKKTKDVVASEFSDKLNSILEGIFDKIEVIISKSTKEVIATQKEVVIATSKKSKLVLLGVCIFGIIMGSFGFILRRVLLNSILGITKSLYTNAHGTLKLSEDIRESSNELSNSSKEQTQEISKISLSLQEIASVASSNVNGAIQAGQFSKEIYSLSEDTKQSMEYLAQAMDQILVSNQRIEKLAGILQEITKKTEMIDDIVFKTQILSFNASVEAARAGDHGRGFSVVAEEVGILARKSETSANDISAFVKNSYLEAQSIVHENKAKVAQGEQLVFETKEKLNNSILKLNQILDVVDRIIQSSKEQETGISHASESVELIKKHIHSTSTSAEKSAQSGSELSTQSTTVSELVKDLNVLIKGAAEVEKELNNVA